MQEAVSEAAASHKPAAPQNPLAALQLPTLTRSSLSCACASAHQLFRWLDKYDLQPYQVSDQRRLVGMLLGLIDEIGQWQAPPARRLAMLDLLREYALACVDAMAIQRAALARAQTAELRKAVLLALQLLGHLGVAYAGIAAQLAGAAPVALLAGRRRAQSLQRAVDCFRRQVRIAALFSLATPRHCWRNMQLLRRYAQLQRIERKPVRDPQHSRGRDSTVGAYLQAALFASANPVQFGIEEQERLWGLSFTWVRAAQIVDRYSDRCNGLLAALALDQPPIPANRLGSCRVDLRHFTLPEGWKIDLGGVLALLEKQLQKRRDSLLEKVQRGWAAPCGRAERRTPLQRRCDLVIGIGAVCFHLGGADRRKTPRYFFDGSAADSDHLCLDVDSVDYASGETLGEYDVVLSSAPGLRRDTGIGNADRRYNPVPANVLNSSDRGIGLNLAQAIGDRLRVGELIGIRLREQWQVAVVRWQFALPDHSRAGGEILRGTALPVRVQRHTVAGHLSAPIAALLLEGEGDEKPSLILPVPLFKCYDTVELLAQSQSRPVTLQKQTLATGSFARFEFV